eukprot:2655007-Rhodomonas_salina.1
MPQRGRPTHLELQLQQVSRSPHTGRCPRCGDKGHDLKQCPTARKEYLEVLHGSIDQVLSPNMTSVLNPNSKSGAAP